MEETSLDDFLDTPESDREDDVTDPASGDVEKPNADAVSSPDPDAGSDPDADPGSASEAGPSTAVATYEWTQGGVDCADCGATVECRWRDGDRFVCADCKAW